MNTALLYGKGTLFVQVPEHSVILEPKHLPGLRDEEAAVATALRNPIGTPPLRDMVKRTDKVAIVISDITRPTPNHKLVPWILKELSHVPLDQFVIIYGTGTHRDQTREEFIHMLGEWVVEHVRVINEAAGRLDQITVIGCDAVDPALDAIRQGKLEATIAEPPFFLGKEAVQTAVTISKGESVEKSVILDSTLVTKENIDQVKTR